MRTQDQKTRSTRSTLRWTSVIALTLIIVVVGLLLWRWNSARTGGTATNTSGASQGNAEMQTNEGGQVTIMVTWQGRSAGPVFTVEMDTHAVDLDSYDLRQLAVLRTDQGQQIQPSGWNAPSGGHHRTGTLTFPARTTSGTPVIGPETHTLELMIRNVSGVPERTFRWTL